MAETIGGERLLEWLKQKQDFHDELAKSGKARKDGAFQLNHASRALAFLEVRKHVELQHEAKRTERDSHER